MTEKIKVLTIGQTFLDFVAHLKKIGKRQNIWLREELRTEYNSFKNGKESKYMCFSSFLYKARQFHCRLVRLRNERVRLLHDFDKSENHEKEQPKSRATPNQFPAVQNGTRRHRKRTNKRKRSSPKVDAKAIVSENPSTPHQKRCGKPTQTQMPIKSSDNPTAIENAKCKDMPYGSLAMSPMSLDRNRPAATKWHRVKRATNIARIEGRHRRTSETIHHLKTAAESQKRRTIAGIRPEFLVGAKRTETVRLKKYAIPSSVEVEYQTGEFRKNLTLLQRLSVENYKEKFHLLLYIEEIKYLKEIQSYAMKSAVLQRKPSRMRLLYLEVPGLAENRPSLLIGDRVYAARLDSKGNEYGDRYEGFVHEVEKQQVGLGFNLDLISIYQRNMKFNVSFTFNRRPLRLMHHALFMMQQTRLAEMLFPRSQPERYVPHRRTLVMKKRAIESNTEQRAAVENIVLGKTPPIYVIFGPPGTGKTVTMVEAIYQTYKRYNYNILVCALCNDACDMLASKLQEYFDKSKMIRIYAASRSWKSVPAKIKEGKTNYRDGELYMPDEEELKSFRIIICTFVTAGRISLMKFPSGYFQRIFIDESGQAFEPECLIAVSGILANDGKLILAGDPKQLGPIVRSPLAIRYGLQMSLLQRLMDTCPLYQKDKKTGEYNPQCVTKLVKNYRSHEVILRISNQHFYDEELLVCADELKRMKMCGWEWLKNKKFPILFHGIEGKQTRDQSSPSYYNPDEVKIVRDYVVKLMESRGTHKMYAASNIGIVTPYRKQCEKIRKAVERYPGIDVGSVEVFQGQERPVIIISTVRSSQEGLTDDAKYHLGFLCDPKRFNVALTRAQALLIVVGNPRLLCLDKYWKSLLEYCLKNKAYCGAKFSSEEFRGVSDMEEIEELFRKIDITSSEKSGIEDDLAAPFWRIEH